jgi:retinol dehydrogenase-12
MNPRNIRNKNTGTQFHICLSSGGAHIILACRNLEKAYQTAKEIKVLTNNDDIVVRKLDLSSLSSIRTFVTEIEEDEEQVDILVNNAGVAEQPYKLTDDGLEYTLCVNYLGNYKQLILKWRK